jgi:hypothetical protein
MGIRGLQTFIDQTFDQLKTIKLHDCNVVLDGDSIFHQMYKGCELTCLFGGEYNQFYHCCINLFESFQKCKIK